MPHLLYHPTHTTHILVDNAPARHCLPHACIPQLTATDIDGHVPLPQPIPTSLNWILNPPSYLPLWLHLELEHPRLQLDYLQSRPRSTLLNAAKNDHARRAPLAHLPPNRLPPYYIPHRNISTPIHKRPKWSMPRNNPIKPLPPSPPRFITPPIPAYAHQLVLPLQNKKDAMPKASTKESKTAKPIKRAKKDKDAPKRALSAYMFFVQDYRDRIKSENPDVSFGEVGKLLGAKWKELSPSEKKPYEDQAEADKVRAAKDKAAYEGPSKTKAKPASKKAVAPPSDDDDDEDDE